jgi:hypothetical protein
LGGAGPPPYRYWIRYIRSSVILRLPFPSMSPGMAEAGGAKRPPSEKAKRPKKIEKIAVFFIFSSPLSRSSWTQPTFRSPSSDHQPVMPPPFLMTNILPMSCLQVLFECNTSKPSVDDRQAIQRLILNSLAAI